jgi:hypothetical protein
MNDNIDQKAEQIANTVSGIAGTDTARARLAERIATALREERAAGLKEGATQGAGHAYFRVEEEIYAPVPPEGERIAITFGRPPVRNELDRTTAYHVRVGVLVVSDMISEPEKFAQIVAQLLNENADRVFDVGV